MNLTLVIRTSPETSTWQTAINIAQSWLHQGNDIALIFLQSDAVLACPQSDHPLKQLLKLSSAPCLACVGSAHKRNTCDQQGQPTSNWIQGIQPGSLGQLAEAISASDKVITLG